MFSVFPSLPMCYRFSHRASFLRATYPSSPLTFSTGSPASHHTSWLSSPLCNRHCWEPSQWWMFLLMSLRKPEEYENIFFLLDTMGMCRTYPINFLLFLPISLFFFCHSGIFVLLKRTQGWTKPESVLSTISLLYFYLLEFYFNVRRCSEEKSGCLMNKNEWLSGWPFFFHLSFIDCH